MKRDFKIFLILAVAALGFTSCYDGYINDYETPRCYFALQKPLRTVIADRNMSIYVGVALSGKRQIDKNDWATYTIDETLLEGTGLTLLPPEYYTLANPQRFTVRKSNTPVADTEVRFTDAFYADPLTATIHYALPLRITDTSMSGGVLEGMDYSVIAIKYASTFSGEYYIRGTRYILDDAGRKAETANDYYSSELTLCAYRELSTLNRNELLREGIGELAVSKTNRVKLTVSATATAKVYDVVVTTADGGYTVKDGIGTYDASGSTPAFSLNYKYSDGTKWYQVEEELVLLMDCEAGLRVETW